MVEDIGPEISTILTEFETSKQSIVDETHHQEQNRLSQEKFHNELQAVINSFQQFGNPFLEDRNDLLVLGHD
jgi:hypothetical protein